MPRCGFLAVDVTEEKANRPDVYQGIFRLLAPWSIAFMNLDGTRACMSSVWVEVFSFVDIEVAPAALVFRGHAGLASVAVPLSF